MDDVAAYYNRNTTPFLRFGRGSRGSGAIHRAVWGPGVTTQRGAMDYVHHRIIAALQTAPEVDGRPQATPSSRRYADLGCGVGGSMIRVHQETGAPVVGVTLSEVQHREAERRIDAAGFGGELSVVCGDFSDSATLDTATAGALLDGAWMVESYNHGAAADRLLSELAARIRSGGTLAICDDFPDPRLVHGELTPRERRWRSEFLRGWHVHTFLTTDALASLADDAGFDCVGFEDYSDYVAVDRPRDLLVRVVAGPAAAFDLRSGQWDNIRGGNALQQLGKRRLIRYGMCVFRRR